MANAIRKFQVAPAIYYGEGSIQILSQLDLKKVCIVADQNTVRCGLVDLLTEQLEKDGIQYTIFDGVQPEPPLSVVAEGLVALGKDWPNTIIAVGGGSVIDAAKAILYFAGGSQGADFVRPLFIAMPTTAGTGSEVSAWSVVTDAAVNAKVPIGDAMLTPDVAILEPRLLVTLPPNVTAESGMDAMTHAIESYISTESNPFANAQSAKAVELLFDNLPKAYHHGEDLEARANTQIAATLAAVAFTSSFLGIAHSIAHAIGSQWHLSHGLGNAMALPYVLAFNGQNPETDQAYARLLQTIGRPVPEGASPTKTIVRMIFDLNQEMGISLCLKDRGVSEADYFSAKPLLIEKAMGDVCTPTNPIPATPEILGMVLDQVYYGGSC